MDESDAPIVECEQAACVALPHGFPPDVHLKQPPALDLAKASNTHLLHPSMKAAFLIAALTLSLAPCASARVGETSQEIIARYGAGKKSKDRLSAPGAETFRHEKNGFFIDVVIVGGKSIMEVIHRKDRIITDEDIKALLKLYDSSSTNWRFDRREKRWERGGKPKLVAYREPGHDDFLCIKDLEACEAAENTKDGIKSL